MIINFFQIKIIAITILYLLISINDVKHFKIPNKLLLIMASIGLVFNFIEYKYTTALLILGISIILFIIFAGLSTFKFKGMKLAGSGDLKLIIVTFIAVPFLKGLVSNIFIINVLLMTAILSSIYSVWLLVSCKFNFFEFGKKLYDLKIPFSLFLFLGFALAILSVLVI